MRRPTPIPRPRWAPKRLAVWRSTISGSRTAICHRLRIHAGRPPASLCHLPEAFFKDLQTIFPGICRACSGIDRSCFTLSVFTQNRPIREAPQHMPATSVGTIPRALVSPYVTFDFTRLTRTPSPPDPSRARQQAVPENPDPLSNSTPTADPISTAASAFSWTLSNAPAQPRRRSKFRRFDVSTFRRFHPRLDRSHRPGVCLPPAIPIPEAG